MKGSRGQVGSGEAGLLALTGCGEVGGGGVRREGLLSPCSWRLFRISRWLVVIDSIWDAFLSSQPPEASAHASFLHRALIPAACKRNIPVVAGQWRLSPCQITIFLLEFCLYIF